MTFVPRSVYELGDPVHEHLAREEASDHHRAAARGQRVLLMADHLVSVLEARSLITDAATTRREVFHALANELYLAGSIDLPDFTNEQSLEALRRGKPLV